MNNYGQFPKTRLRRLRKTDALRSLVREFQLDLNKLVFPLFIRHGHSIKQPIPTMPGLFKFSIDQLESEIKTLIDLGIKNIILFGTPAEKDDIATTALQHNGLIQTAIPVIKEIASDLLIMSDICCCQYMEHGHCGVIPSECHGKIGQVDNDKTLQLLAKQALSHARAGTDIIAPSANMDGMVQAIRQMLDEHGFEHLPILSYSIKYASSLYGPFRQATEGAPAFGDRRSYQMDCANQQEALRECALDIAEGADMLMVKPAHTYLDIICRVKQMYPALPLCAYHTSGEYAMIKAAAEKGWVKEREAVLEILTAIHRAGADFIITYFAKDLAKWL